MRSCTIVVFLLAISAIQSLRVHSVSRFGNSSIADVKENKWLATLVNQPQPPQTGKTIAYITNPSVWLLFPLFLFILFLTSSS